MAKLERKKNYVDSSVQGALIMRIMFHWVCFVGITAFLFVVLKTMLGDPDISMPERLTRAVSEYSLLGIVILAILPAFVLDTIRFSNRFVGPVVRLRRALRELGESGTTEPIQFRNNDFWQEIATDVNRVIQRIQTAKQAEQEPADGVKV